MPVYKNILVLAKFQYHTNVPLGVCDRHTEMVSSSTKNGGLTDSETLNIPYSPCFPYSLKCCRILYISCLRIWTDFTKYKTIAYVGPNEVLLSQLYLFVCQLVEQLTNKNGWWFVMYNLKNRVLPIFRNKITHDHRLQMCDISYISLTMNY